VTAGWKVKISDKERLEPPHVTIINGTTRWRYGLRNDKPGFLDDEPPPNKVPQGLVEEIEKTENMENLRKNWNKIYPGNPC
jgi:hypothetical protein